MVTSLHAVVLTHAHLDHTGRLPLLTRFDYQGPIYATPATIDAGRPDPEGFRPPAAVKTRAAEPPAQRRGQPPLEPLYTPEDVERLQPLYRRLRYDHPTRGRAW